LELEEVQLPEELAEYIRSKGITRLYPPQEEAVKAGLLEGQNLVISSPTASGKTLIAMMAAYSKAKAQGRKVVYLAPLRALASEKYAEFSEFARFGLRTTISTGDYDSTGESLGKSDIIVLTNERFDSVMRHRVSWLGSVGLFIADEVHLAGNDSRGPTLEMILTKVLHMGADAQILALSATISNAETISQWLGSRSVQLDWRPVPLREGVYDYGRVVFTDGEERPVPRSTYGAPIDVAMDTLKGGGQSLIFASTRRRAVSLATRASELTQRYMSPEERKAASEASRRILSSGEETTLSRLLAEIVARGSAFHHAGLETEHRRIVEEYYRARAIKLLAATPTLCLPAGEEIFCNATPRAIELLNTDHRVLTHLNRFKDVIAPVSRRYRGPLLQISARGQLPMSMTPEHMVLRVSRKRHSIRSGETNRHWRTNTKPEWVRAREVVKGDLVLFPRLKEESDCERIILPPQGRLSNQTGTVGTHWSRLKRDEVTLDNTSLERLGNYVAVGYAEPNGAVYFAISQDETRLTHEIKAWLSSLGLRVSVEDRSRHRRIIVACSKQLSGKLREMFGTRAPAKRIPDELFLLPMEKVIPLIRGMWRGDCLVSDRPGEEAARFTTTSRVLAKQLFVLLVKLGFMPSLVRGRRADPPGRKSVGTDSSHQSDQFEIKISGRQLVEFCEVVLKRPMRESGSRSHNVNHIDDDYYYMQVRKVERVDYDGFVYNLEVQGDSSYVGSFVVHNSAGVNLPARRVVVADMTRYDAGQGGNADISVLEYRQMAGRAGRPQYDDHGETVIIPPPSRLATDVLEHYAKEPPEPIESRLAEESAMRSHTLATVATGSGLSKGDLDGLFRRTLLAKQVGEERVGKLTERALGYLLSERLLESHGEVYFATDFGRRVSMLYVDPVTGVMFRDAVRKAEQGGRYTAGILRLVAGTPDFEPKFPLRTKDYEGAMAFLEDHSGEMLSKPTPKAFAEYDQVLQDMRSVMALYGWIDEWKEEQLLTRLGVEPGDMHRAVDNADWLLHALGEMAKLFKRPDMVRQAETLRLRVASGVGEELVELTTLQGVGRVRARALYSAGFKTLEDVKEASAEKLALVDKVGTSVARKIKEQVARY
jgi:ATP-dependent DNA helicase